MDKSAIPPVFSPRPPSVPGGSFQYFPDDLSDLGRNETSPVALIPSYPQFPQAVNKKVCICETFV